MAQAFRAFLVDQHEDQFVGDFKEITLDHLPDGDVTIRVHYSSINFKDMLATRAHNKIIRKYPMIPGIDLAGVVMESEHPSFKEGDKVIATGYDLGVSHYGGFSEVARVSGDWLVHLPDDLTLEEAMIIGTAGFTAALSIQLLEDNKITSTNGPVLVRGATGGVGSMAVMMLNEIGYKVIASSGHKDYHEKLLELGAREVISRVEDVTEKALTHTQWQAAIDPVGGETVSEVLKRIHPHGAVALSGNVSGNTFSSTVFPFILRGIRLIGVDSVSFPMKRRQHLWRRLSKDLKPRYLHDVKNVIPFEQLQDGLDCVQNHDFIGRVVVDLRPDANN